MYDSQIEYEEYVLYATVAESELVMITTEALSNKVKDILNRIAEKASSLVSKIVAKFIALVKKANVVVLDKLATRNLKKGKFAKKTMAFPDVPGLRQLMMDLNKLPSYAKDVTAALSGNDIQWDKVFEEIDDMRDRVNTVREQMSHHKRTNINPSLIKKMVLYANLGTKARIQTSDVNIKRIKSKINGIKETAATMQVHQLTSRFINLFVTMTSLIFRITRLAINNLRRLARNIVKTDEQKASQ